MDRRAASRLLPIVLAGALAACSAGSTASPSASQAVVASVSPSQATSAAPSGSASAAASPSQDSGDGLPAFSCSLPIHAAATINRAQISSLAVSASDSYDRIVFTFTAGLPEVTVSRAEPPFAMDPSGLPISLQGTSFLKILLHNGTTVLPEGGRSYSGDVDFSPHFATLTEMKSGGDFEAVSAWYVGMSKEACVRVFALEKPSRLVVDLQH